MHTYYTYLHDTYYPIIQQLPTEHMNVRYPTGVTSALNKIDTTCPHKLPIRNEGWMQHRHQQQIKRCLFVYSTVGQNNGKEYWDNQNQSVGGNSTLNEMLRAGLRSDPNLKWRPHIWCDAGNRRPFLMSIFTVTLEGFWKASPGSLNVVLEDNGLREK